MLEWCYTLVTVVLQWYESVIMSKDTSMRIARSRVLKVVCIPACCVCGNGDGGNDDGDNDDGDGGHDDG
jgi:hypothetical protein